MEETDTKQQKMEMSQEEAKQLKYLDFLQIAAVRAAVFVSSVYNFAKENSGPLKSGVQTVEGTVKTVVGPVYEKFHDVPSELLKFADRKVDGIVHVVDRHVPPLVKEATTQALCTAQKAPAIARSVSSEVQRTGVTEAAKTAYAKLQPTAKDLYDSYEPVAERYAVSAWHSLHRLPLFPEVSRVMVPTAAYWSEKYNSAVCFTADHGYAVSAYLPLVPTERIAKVFGGEEGAEVVDKPQAVTAVAVAVA